MEWAPYLQMKWDSPITGMIDKWLPDKTRLQAEFVFLALERPEESDKLGSFEVTGGWMNEVREMDKGIFDKLTERTGRFPPTKDGHGPTWRGIVMDTNPPDTEHWLYRLSERSDPDLMEQMEMVERNLRKIGFLKEREKLFEFFKQPGGLIKLPNGEYEPNPEAENIPHLDGGYGYYYRQIAGKSDQWIESQVLGNYAILVDGRPVWPEYVDNQHCKEIQANPKNPLVIGMDFGLTPAVAICQVSARGQLLVLDEVCSDDMGISQFARDMLKPHLAMNWHDYTYLVVGDPAGVARAQSNERTCFQELLEQGIPAVPALTNEFIKRRESVAKYLLKSVGSGNPGFLVHPRCTRIRKGLIGGYHYRRVQQGGGTAKYREVPDKNLYSHPCLAAETMVSMALGQKPISEVRMGDFVRTPKGLRRVTNAWLTQKQVQVLTIELSSGRRIFATPNHRFWANNSWIRADALQYGDILLREALWDANAFIQLTAEKKQPNGMARKKEGRLLAGLAQWLGLANPERKLPAHNAASPIYRFLSFVNADSARRLASLPHVGKAAKTMRSVLAKYAKDCLSLIVTPKHKPALKIVGVSLCQDRKDVYDLTVDDQHCFYAEGILVHNCEALQYASLYTQLSDSVEFNKEIVYTEQVL